MEIKPVRNQEEVFALQGLNRESDVRANKVS